MALNSTFPGIFERGKKMSSGIKFCPAPSFANASQLGKQSLRSCFCLLVYLLPSSYTTRWVSSLLYSLESIFSIWCRSCSTLWMFTCILSTMWLHEIILRRSTRNLRQAELTGHLPTAVLTQAVSNLKNLLQHIFSLRCLTNSSSRGKRSSSERKTILSHLPRTLKVFWWLTYPFLLNNKIIFHFAWWRPSICHHR